MSRNSHAVTLRRNFPALILYSTILAYFVHRWTVVPARTRIEIRRDNSATISHPLLTTSKVQNNTPSSTSPTRTLVIYAYGETHASAKENLLFFIRTAVRSSHDADYYFILQRVKNQVFDEKELPPLPPNAQYIQHEDKCFDLGAVGWLLSTGRINKSNYKYFVLVNSSVRGPFIVSYYYDPVWYTIFTRRLNNYIRLVGCTFTCQIYPHIQSYVWAMNMETFDFLINNTMVFTCHRSFQRTIRKGEVAASRVLFQAGYGVESLMTKYRGIDLRVNFMQNCSYQLNPTTNDVVDGVTLDPYEVVFVKVKAGNRLYTDNLARARVYEKWVNE